MDIQLVIKDLNYKVLVNCMTYNQSQYIEDALNGFAMQQTNFPFVCLVMDDASTDGEQEVLRSYVDREGASSEVLEYEDDAERVVVVPHKTNTNCIFAISFLKKNLFGKEEKLKLILPWVEKCDFVAFCEGDDFWTNPKKIQRQFEVMESDSSVSVCYNRVQAVSKDGVTKKFLIPIDNDFFGEGFVSIKNLADLEFVNDHWCFHTSSFFLKKEIYVSHFLFRKTYLPSFPYGDMPLQLYALLNGRGYFIEETMGCYRLFSGGWNSMMATDQELNKNTTKNIIKGFKEFDRYTHYKYHKSIKIHNLRKEYKVLYGAKSHKLKFLRFNYITYRLSVVTFLKKKFPFVYSILKSLRS